MLFNQFTAILGLAAGLASAVDIHYYVNANSCSGVRTSCTNIASNTCCRRVANGGTPARSILFTMNRRILVRGHTGPFGDECRDVVVRQNANPNHCMSRADGGTFNGAGWGEPTLRRSDVETAQCLAGENKCNETVRPDKVALADGTEYDVQSLDEAKYNELVALEHGLLTHTVTFSVEAALSETFAVAESVPEEFKSLRVTI
ncbi:hypothetical protein LZ31DRAFT_484087 [Colletotrichum somersetense]|nr:hypothetical protein LZ31DRAFT_484087 [Colletotrichum somersetense]